MTRKEWELRANQVLRELWEQWISIPENDPVPDEINDDATWARVAQLLGEKDPRE